MTFLSSASAWGVGLVRGYHNDKQGLSPIAPIGSVGINAMMLAMQVVDQVKAPFMWPVVVIMSISVASATYCAGNFLGQAVRSVEKP